jgi:hypothetical protein
MNKPLKTVDRAHLTFGDLVAAVSSCSRNSREATLAIVDLLQSRRVILRRERDRRRRH